MGPAEGGSAEDGPESEGGLAAEVGLSGEIRPVNRVDQRIHEAQKLGFEKIIISKSNSGIKPEQYDIEVVKCGKIEEVVRNIFG